jgi:hypothetical protein
MTYEVIFSPKSYKQIESFDKKLKERIKKAAVEIGNDPWHKGTIKVEGYENVIIVSNAGPIIALASIGKLDLLKQFMRI